MVSAEMLSSVPIFEELSNEMIKRLSAIAELKVYPENVFLNHRKRNAEYFYIILAGEIGLQMESLTGKTVRLETITQGGAIGFSSLIEMASRQYISDAKTLTPVKVLRFAADEMMLIFYQDFELGFLVMKKIAWIVKRRLMDRTLPIPKL